MYPVISLHTGFTSNGEWNSLRSKGNSRPLSIFEVRSLARRKYSHLSAKRMIGMLTPKCESVGQICVLLIEVCCKLHLGGKDGIIEAEVVNRAVPTKVLKEILTWKGEGCTIDDIVTRLRNRTVPSGYAHHMWSEGKQRYRW